MHAGLPAMQVTKIEPAGTVRATVFPDSDKPSVALVRYYLNTAHVEGIFIENGPNLGLCPQLFAAVDQYS
jgi:hypothetical protein